MNNVIGTILGYGLGAIYRNKISGIIFSVLVLILNLIGLIEGDIIRSILLTIIIFFPVLIVVGVVSRIADIARNKRNNAYTKMFEAMRFCSSDGQYPVLAQESIINHAQLLVFHSQIPLDVWIAKKSLLETHLNKQIIKITNNYGEKNVVILYLVNENLPEILYWNNSYLQPQETILVLGIDYTDIIHIDLNHSPHAFIAGETGSGKSNILKCLIYQCLIKEHEVKLIDFKRGVSFFDFSNLIEVYFDYDRITAVLEELVTETNKRLDLFVKYRVENMDEYNSLVSYEKRLKRVVVFIDELAELMRAGDKEGNKQVTGYLETLTRVSRASGINLIMGIQRPDSTVINGQIKSNVSMRICGRFVDPEPSRIMIGNDMAKELPNIKGRFILRNEEFIEFQSFYINSDLMIGLDKVNVMNHELEQKTEPETIQEQEREEPVMDFDFDEIEL